jgi:hypothetical protein
VRSTQWSRRFELRADVWFRTSRDADWRTGVSRSVSTTDAIVESDDLPSTSDAIAVVIALSDSGCLVGQGRVTRTEPSAGPERPAHFTIAVDHYAIEHREAVLSHS